MSDVLTNDRDQVRKQVAADIREAVQRNTSAPPTALRPTEERAEEFAKLRAHVIGTLISAKRQLVPNDEWLVTDQRIVDIVLAWLDQNRR